MVLNKTAIFQMSVYIYTLLGRLNFFIKIIFLIGEAIHFNKTMFRIAATSDYINIKSFTESVL